MAKKFLVTLVAFITVFFLQAQVWAAANNADQITQTEQTYTIDSSFFNEEAPFQVAQRMGAGGNDSILWIASIFITGLGQVLMGDLWRGLKFALLAYGAPIVASILATVLVAVGVGSGNAGFLGISGILYGVSGLIWLVVHIWNILDAYNMSQEISGMADLNANQLAELESRIQAAKEFSNKIQVSESGVSVKAFAF